MANTNHLIDAGVQVGNKLTVGGTMTAIGSGVTRWLTENYQVFASLGILCGIGVGVAGILINRHYQKKRDKREEARDRREALESQARLRQITGEL
ncbi:hypothetical protein [Porticoccus sp.]